MSLFRKVCLGAAAALAVGAAAPVAIAQDMTEEDLKIQMQAYEASRKAAISDALRLSSEEAEQFWPMYETYRKEQLSVGKEKLDLIADIVVNYGQLDEETAKKMRVKGEEIEKKELQHTLDFHKSLEGKISEAKIARFYQIERRLRAGEALSIAQNVPLVQ